VEDRDDEVALVVEMGASSIFGFTFANHWGVDGLVRQSDCSYVLLPTTVLEVDVIVG
jgi:hypothetical protein